MSLSAQNYASQVSGLIPIWIEEAERQKRHNDAFALKSVLDIINKSHHFTLPDGGKVFDNELRGLHGIEARLPYPAITVESRSRPTDKNTTPFGEDSEIWNVKQLSVASEVDTGVFKSALQKLGDKLNIGSVDFPSADFLCSGGEKIIVVNSFCTLNTDPDTWKPAVGSLFIKAGDFKIGSGNEGNSLYDVSADRGGFTTRPFLIDVFDMMVERYPGGAEEALKDISSDSLVDVMPLLELCEALSCSNVEAEPAYNIGSQGKPRKKGKSPLFETHRLVLKRPGSQKSVQGSEASGIARRAHLRRGHIRRLPKGNIWVNACAVGELKNGFLHKDYGVTA